MRLINRYTIALRGGQMEHVLADHMVIDAMGMLTLTRDDDGPFIVVYAPGRWSNVMCRGEGDRARLPPVGG